VNLLRKVVLLVATVGLATTGDGAAARAGDAGAPATGAAAAYATNARFVLAEALTRLDALYRRRDDRAAWAEEQTLVEATLARAPQDFGVLWRAARFYFWLSDDPGLAKDERSRLGKDGWDLAERAVAANPNRVEGHYWAALCMGNYALGLGVMRALTMGLESKFRERLGRAGQLDARYEQGGIEIAWGRFFDKLPWPKRDRGAAEQHLKRAIELNPANLRARVYLASSYLDQDRAVDAKRLLDEVAAAPAGRFDPPEERRAKALGVGLMRDVAAKLK
jgi:hypothetical protein